MVGWMGGSRVALIALLQLSAAWLPPAPARASVACRVSPTADAAEETARLVRARRLLEEVTGKTPIDGGAVAVAALPPSPEVAASRIRDLRFSTATVAEPDVQYDPKALEDRLFRQPVRWLVRNVQLFVPLAGFVASVLIDWRTGVEEEKRRERARQLLRIISGLGPAIIKAGQALSSRPDLLPAEYLEELQKLQDEVPPFSNEEAFAAIESELGLAALSDVFELVQPEPVAAASIGQVYKARLTSNPDRIVALKAQRPGCEEQIALDLYILRYYARILKNLLSALGRNIDVVSVIDDFGELIYREIDYKAEAENARRFAELYSGIPDVYVPRMYNELSTGRVITMEWVEGVRLVDREGLRRYGVTDTGPLVDTLVQCSMRQMLETGFFHADPHAGNLLAMQDGRLCYLDFGMMSYVESFQRIAIIEAVVHLVNRDFASLAALFQKLGFVPPGQDTSPIVVALEEALPDVLDASVGELNFKNVVGKLGDIMYKYPFSLPPFYIAIIRCLGVLEGLAIQVDRDFRIISDAYPYIASRLLTDPQPELRDALRQLLFKDGQPRYRRLEQLLEKASGTRDYDVTEAIEQLANYLTSEEAAPMLDTFSVQLLDVVDQLSLDVAAAVGTTLDELRLLAQAGRFDELSQRLDELLARLSGDAAVGQEDAAPALAAAAKLARVLSQSQGFDAQRLVPVLRRLLGEPAIQRVSVDLAVGLSERAVSRGIRGLFNLRDETPPGGHARTPV